MTRSDTSPGQERCYGRRVVQRFESGGDSAKDTGWANLSQKPCPGCPDCQSFKVRSTTDGLRRDRDELIEGLWECMKAAGADTSYADSATHAYKLGEVGQPTLAVAAVQAVEELRKDYDECPTPEDLERVTSERDRLRSALERIAAAKPLNTASPLSPGEIAREALQRDRPSPSQVTPPVISQTGIPNGPAAGSSHGDVWTTEELDAARERAAQTDAYLNWTLPTRRARRAMADRPYREAGAFLRTWIFQSKDSLHPQLFDTDAGEWLAEEVCKRAPVDPHREKLEAEVKRLRGHAEAMADALVAVQDGPQDYPNQVDVALGGWQQEEW